MSRLSRRRLFAALCCAVVPALWTFVAVTQATAADEAWPWLKYEIGVVIVATADAQLSPRRREELSQVVLRRLHESVGTVWNVRLTPVTPTLATRLAGDIANVDVSRLEKPAAATLDKTFLVAIDGTSGTLTVRVRDWDPQFQSLGPVVVAETSDRALLSDVVAETVLDAFRAPARILDIDQDVAKLTIRGAFLFPPEMLRRFVRSDEGFQPYLRLRNRDGEVVDSRAVPWTLLKVADFATAGGLPVVNCRITSGVRDALVSSRRGRSERWALAVGRPRGGTWLKAAGPRGTPLADCQAFRLLADRQYASLGKTDADGKVLVPAGDGQVETIIVTSRFLPLARLPLVPGLVDELSLPVAAGAGLRRTEDWLADWQSEFLDLYIRRRALLTTIGYRIERNEIPLAERLLTDVDRLGVPTERIHLLEIRRREAVGDFPAEAKILDGLFAQAKQAVAPLDDAQAVIELRDPIKRAPQN